MPKFRFTHHVCTTYNIELDQSVIDVVDDDWRASMYDLRTPEEIAEHIGRNLHNGLRLSQMDGWADMADELARAQCVAEEEDYWADEVRGG